MPDFEIPDNVVTTVANSPNCPGVYLMKDSNATIIYVGKAKDLKKRLQTYMRGGDDRSQIEFLLRRLDSLETIVTESEYQAFVLERDLIRKFKPRYNIRLKDDKAYLSIRFDTNVDWPRLELVRKVEQDGALYFGPYASSYELREILSVVNKVVPLRTCTNTVFYNRQRPCLEYQIKQCCGPCCLPVAQEDYQDFVKQAMTILEGKTGELVKSLKQSMEKASEDLRFEDAALLRDRIQILQRLSKEKHLVAHKGEDRDCFGLYRELGLGVVSVLRIRKGTIVDTSNFKLDNLALSDEEIIEQAVVDFYERQSELPPEILLPYEIGSVGSIKQYFQTRLEKNINCVVPKRGLKKRFLNLAVLNAQQSFKSFYQREFEISNVLKDMALKFKLSQVPRRIECLDISNLQGSDIVAGLVSFYDGVPDKSRYRRYNISLQGKPDDFYSIYEAVKRRLKSAMENDDFPDLLLIDGGRGQLSKALEARDELGLSLDIISIAKIKPIGQRRFDSKQVPKKPERVFLEAASASIPLPSKAELTHFMQRVRDEAHRFVISLHRHSRNKRVLSSELDNIPGIGPTRKALLLKTFGSIEGIKSASEEQLRNQGRLPPALARIVLARLRKR